MGMMVQGSQERGDRMLSNVVNAATYLTLMSTIHSTWGGVNVAEIAWAYASGKIPHMDTAPPPKINTKCHSPIMDSITLMVLERMKFSLSNNLLP